MDRLWGWMEWKVWIPSLVFSASVPRLFCGFVPSFLTNLKNLPFFLDLICAIIQRCFISGRGERAVFFLCASSSCSLLLLLPLPLFLIFNMGSFSLTTLLGLPSVCLSRLLRLHPAEGRERERNISTDSLLRSWSQDGKRRCDSYACTRERELLYVGYGCGRSVTVVVATLFFGIHLYLTPLLS